VKNVVFIPKLWHFILVKGIWKQHILGDLEYNEAARGQASAAKKPKLVTREENILDIVMEYDARSTLEYIRAIAHNA